MKVRRALSLSALVLTLGSLTVAACSSDPDTVYIYVEGGVADAGKRDARTNIDDDSGDDPAIACEPSPVPDFTFKAPPAYQGFCSDQDITNFLTGCVFDEGTQELCKAAIDSLSDACGECIYGGFNADPAAPLVQYTDQTPVYANSGTCMANLVNNQQDECAVAFGQIETCTYAACVPPCTGQSEEAKAACYDKAIGTVCTKGLETFDKCRSKYTDKTYGFCLTGDNPDAGNKKLNNLEYYTLVTKLACGTRPAGQGDGGVVDSGKPDTGVVDSGAPDADANAPDADASLDAGADADADADAN